jgi:prevent-host-death family protein
MESKEMRVREVRDQLGKRVDAAHYGGEATVITTNGERRAVLVPYEWYIAVEDARESSSP